MKTVSIFILIVGFQQIRCTPILLWHGFGDDHLDTIKEIIKVRINESVYVKSVQLGDSSLEDFESGIFIHPNDQISMVCNEIAEDKNLHGGFHAVGFSQGAQFL
jgi:palmitoyl-protein thioesterase